MTLNGVMALILRYFTEFGSFRGALRKSGWRCRRKKFAFAISSPGEFLVYLSRIAVLRTFLYAAYCYRPSSVVCRSVTVVRPVKTAELIEMPFGLRTLVGLSNHVLDGGPLVVHAINTHQLLPECEAFTTDRKRLCFHCFDVLQNKACIITAAGTRWQ